MGKARGCTPSGLSATQENRQVNQHDIKQLRGGKDTFLPVHWEGVSNGGEQNGKHGAGSRKKNPGT